MASAKKKTTAKSATKTKAKTAKKSTAKKSTKKSKKSSAKEKAPSFHPQEHTLVPRHEIMSEEEIQEFFERYDVQPTNLPTIYINDPALKGMEVKIGDIIRISRTSRTAGDSVFYRRVAYE